MPTLQQVFRCDRPVALITGSGSARVGRAIASHLAQLGCHLAIHANESITEAEQAASDFREEFGVDVIVLRAALEKASAAESIVEDTFKHFGRIDVLVNSAAIWYPTKLDQITADEIRHYFEVNTLASFLTARAAGVRMSTQDAGGSIINIGDWATVRPYVDHAAYFPSKGGIEVMTRSLAVELAQKNPRIRVNCIQPGPVLLEENVSDQRAKLIAESTLVERVGTPEHVAHAVQFLCENDFVTGICLPVDGGRSIYAPDGLQVGLNTG